MHSELDEIFARAELPSALSRSFIGGKHNCTKHAYRIYGPSRQVRFSLALLMSEGTTSLEVHPKPSVRSLAVPESSGEFLNILVKNPRSL